MCVCLFTTLSFPSVILSCSCLFFSLLSFILSSSYSFLSAYPLPFTSYFLPIPSYTSPPIVTPIHFTFPHHPLPPYFSVLSMSEPPPLSPSFSAHYKRETPPHPLHPSVVWCISISGILGGNGPRHSDKFLSRRARMGSRLLFAYSGRQTDRQRLGDGERERGGGESGDREKEREGTREGISYLD